MTAVVGEAGFVGAATSGATAGHDGVRAPRRVERAARGVLDELDLEPYGPGRVRVRLTPDGVWADDPDGALAADPVEDPCAAAAHAWLAMAYAWRAREDRAVAWSPRFVRLVVNDLHDVFCERTAPVAVEELRRRAVGRALEAHAWATAVGAPDRAVEG